ncbi:PAS-domain containing protein [Macromonas nakdongensis]|uniref:PAS-domain containing protein n=1 Tax=Macromonas nakdongensis TaxID=1843082 RepID=UPI000C341D3A|nr:PAS-domain containing protein [Macromonas nakdongensis]
MNLPVPPAPAPDCAQRHDALQVALDLIDQGISLMDSELRLVAWNQGFLRLLGFPSEMAYVGAPFESFIRYNAERGEYGPGDPDEQVASRVAAARAFEAHEIERTRPDGTVLRVQGVPVPRHGFISLYSDITAQRRREAQHREHNAGLESRVLERTNALLQSNQQLREALQRNESIADSLTRSESRIRLITDSIPALVAYFGNDRRYHYVNRGYQEWFGLDPSRPERINAREFLGADTYARIRPNVMQAVQGVPVTFEYETRTVHRGLRIARTSLIPEKAPDGSFVGCFELTFDITDELLAQSRMAQAQKMEALGQLTGGLAHDFNNILTVVHGNLAALLDKPELRPYAADYLQPALEAAKRGSDLIRGLLSFARKQPLSSQVVDINESLRSTIAWLRSVLPDTLVLHAHTEPEPVPVKVDPNRLRDALLNLALNARDATEGKGHITCRSARVELSAETAESLRLRPGAYAQISVQDDGAGMDPATLNRVFEPFFSTKAAGKGSGLGMSMVYGFVQQSAGAIDLRSAPGEGTTVSILLPLQVDAHTDPRPAELGQPWAEVHDEGGLGLALLVEDDPSVRRWLRRELLDCGYSVIEAENGDEARLLIDHTPDIRLLLSDVVMPGDTDGFALVRHAQQHAHIPQIVLMSGFVPSGDAPPEVPLLNKPFTRAELLDVLAKAP